MGYWLMKSEPSCFSIDDLKRLKVGMWDDVRNYQARNFMRDKMKKGDLVLFYHSSIAEPGVVGIALIVKEAYPDPTQFEVGTYKSDPKATKEKPIWVAVDLKFREKFAEACTLSVLKNDPFFSGMLVVQRGMRLSVQPVDKKHFDKIVKRYSHNI
jgi:predicted RNA-binding protein with PUA-like domain